MGTPGVLWLLMHSKVCRMWSELIKQSLPEIDCLSFYVCCAECFSVWIHTTFLLGFPHVRWSCVCMHAPQKYYVSLFVLCHICTCIGS